ncbi:unnamed protein product, partial [Didymodactylos carnosus]
RVLIRWNKEWNNVHSYRLVQTNLVLDAERGTDPTVRSAAYQLSEPMFYPPYDFSTLYIVDKGYISLGQPLYQRDMTESVFNSLDRAIIAPYWISISYIPNLSKVFVNMYNTSSSLNDIYDVINQTIIQACPTLECDSVKYNVMKILRIQWTNMQYQSANGTNWTNIQFSVFIINAYDTALSTRSVLRTYLAFDYRNLPSIPNLNPFVGYRSQPLNNTLPYLRILNDQQNSAFIGPNSITGMYMGGRFLTKCEYDYWKEVQEIQIDPTKNLYDTVVNPRFPCPCTYDQILKDQRFISLNNENQYEKFNNIICFGPRNQIRVKTSKNTYNLLNSQTCCYNSITSSMIISGPFAGSVLRDPSIIYQPTAHERRIPERDDCCVATGNIINWNTCKLYYQIRPASDCDTYRPPSIVWYGGDPHVYTIDGSLYTCHIVGRYIFARTSSLGNSTAFKNDNLDESPLLPYIRSKGYASVFTRFILSADEVEFSISSQPDSTFILTVSNNLNITLPTNDVSYSYTKNDSERPFSIVQTTYSQFYEGTDTTLPELTISLWSGLTLTCTAILQVVSCTLLLPDKFKTYIEGLAGNFDGDATNDLRYKTNDTIVIDLKDDSQVYDACVSCQYCDEMFNPCNLPGVCEVNFQYGATCTFSQNDTQPYVCDGDCLDGFESLDNYTCSEADGTWPLRCPDYGTICNYNSTLQNYTCDCYSPYFINTNGTCLLLNTSLCDNSTYICQFNTLANLEMKNVQLSSDLYCLGGKIFNNGTCEYNHIDECELGMADCPLIVSYCVDTNGSYICECNSGYEFMIANQTNSTCQDINECVKNPLICTNYTMTFCENVPGTHECRCNPGYAPDENIYGIQPQCVICEYLETGQCNNNNNACNCFLKNNVTYEQPYCENSIDISLKSTGTTNWTVLLGVVSGIAGLLLAISLCMCAYFIYQKRRRPTTKTVVSRSIWTIPRVKLPTLGSMVPFDDIGFTYNEGNSDDGSTHDLQIEESISSTYRATYDSEQTLKSIDSQFFKDLENITSLRTSRPRPQISSTIDTLNSIPVNSDMSTNVLEDFDELSESEFITDLMDDMIKNDINDDFTEALNPHLAIPRVNSTTKSDSLFSVNSEIKV